MFEKKYKMKITDKRPILTITTDPKTFQKYYWEKKELIHFCRANNLPAQGEKSDLAERIEKFLRTGEIKKVQARRKVGSWDSDKGITKETRVVNYKNDTKTRLFFEAMIGPKFRFNAYLRQFSKAENIEKNLTYGDLVEGWLEAEAKKKNSQHNTAIDQQFQFNQFQRDFYFHEKGKSRAECMAAWKLVRSVAGPADYKHYLTLVDEENDELL